MSGEKIVIGVGLAAAMGLVLLLILWPSPRKGERVLARWGVHDPSDAEVADAVGYLKRRRITYPWTFLAVSAGYSTLTGDDSSFLSALLSALVVGALLAELWAQRPTRGAPRSALLVPRRMRDLVPLWSAGAFAVLFVVVVGTAVAAVTSPANSSARYSRSRVRFDCPTKSSDQSSGCR